jgi:hypothetical protein
VTAPDSYGQNISLWQMTDAPSIPDAIKLLADGVIPRGVMRFTSASARGAALVGEAAPVEGMATWLYDVNRLEIYNGSDWITPEPTLVAGSSGLSAYSGFSVIDFFGYRQGRMTVLDMYLTRTGATIQSTNGNIADTAACLVPTSWRPTHDTIAGCFDTGVVHGGFVVGVDGIVTLRTASNDLANNTNLRLHISFLRTTF